MKDQSPKGLLRIPAALLMGLAISIISLKAPGIFQVTEASPSWLGAFITHSFMWMLSLLAILLLIRGRLRDYGFAKGEYRFTPKIFLWVIPTAVLSVMAFLATRGGAQVKEGLGLSPLESIIFVWFSDSLHFLCLPLNIYYNFGILGGILKQKRYKNSGSSLISVTGQID